MKKTIKTFISKTLSTIFIFSLLMPSVSAYQNHVYTTTTNESYSASSPVGRFENSTINGAIAPIYNYNYSPYPAYMPPQSLVYQPYAQTDENNQSAYLKDSSSVNPEDTQGTQVATTTPALTTPAVSYSYPAPMYTAGAVYANPNYNQTASVQDIKAPQDYNKTVTTTQQYVDTREKADKIIDRGVKVFGTLAAVGAAAGLLINAL